MKKFVFSGSLVAVTLFLSFKSTVMGISLFTLHPTLMSIGYLLLMSHAILLMTDGSFLGQTISKYQTKLTLHWVLQSVGVACIFIGFGAIFNHKENNHSEHFETLHGNWGRVTALSTYAVLAGGILAKYSSVVRKLVKPVVIKAIHSILGSIVYVLGVITTILGLYSLWWEQVSSSEARTFILVILLVTTPYVVFESLKSNIRRLRGSNKVNKD